MVSERLVEEAAKAIREVRWSHALPHSNPGGANWTDKDLARAALAVFEAAQAPTGDEREELIGLQLASITPATRTSCWSSPTPPKGTRRDRRLIGQSHERIPARRPRARRL